MILDCIGGSFVEQNLKSIATDGRWVLYGLLGGGNVDGNILGALLRKRVSLFATTLRSRSLEVGCFCVYSSHKLDTSCNRQCNKDISHMICMHKHFAFYFCIV